MNPTPPRQPIFNIPAVIVVVIVAMAGIQGVREALPDRLDADLLARFAFVPGRLTYVFDPAAVLRPWAHGGLDDQAGRNGAAVAGFFLGEGTPQPWTVLTYAVLHGSWTHLGLNTVWLLAFGTPLARRLGPLRFLLFTALGAVAGSAAHYAVDPTSLQPLVGASAAVSACMAGTLRFMFRTRAGGQAPFSDRQPRLDLRSVFTDRRALAFLAAWFLTNIATGVAAGPLGLSDSPIAWQAHIGGFLIGLLAFPLFDRGSARARAAGPDAAAGEPGA